MAAFQDFKVPGGRVESGLMGGIKEKNQGKRLGLIRDFLCEINRFGPTASSRCGTCGVNCNWTLSPETVIRTFPTSSPPGLPFMFDVPPYPLDHGSEITGRRLFSWKQ